MELVEEQQDNHTNIFMVISHRFEGFPNIVCSGNKMCQLPCQIGKKSFQLKELRQKYHQGYLVYLIQSKRVSTKTLKGNSIRVNEKFLIETIKETPF
jgi:hypothetical protein